MKFNQTTLMQFKFKVYMDLVETMVFAKGMEQATINVTFVHQVCYAPRATNMNNFESLSNVTKWPP
jgi:hypothetical protein